MESNKNSALITMKFISSEMLHDIIEIFIDDDCPSAWIQSHVLQNCSNFQRNFQFILKFAVLLAITGLTVVYPVVAPRPVTSAGLFAAYRA